MRMEDTDVWEKGEEILEGGVDKKLNQSKREREKRCIVG